MKAGQVPGCWPVDPREARRVQESLRHRVLRSGDPGPVRRVAGVDAAYDRRHARTFAAAVSVERGSLRLEASALASAPTRFPYVPGLLSFREAPTALQALAMLPRSPDLLLVDGHGYAHPRRFGIACHIGVLLNVATIGVAKSRLVGRHADPGPARGDRAPLVDHGEVVGMVVRTRNRVRPVYVSVGHRIDLDAAVRWVLELGAGFRLPEPLRFADRLSRCHQGALLATGPVVRDRLEGD